MRYLTLILASLLFSCKEEGGSGTVSPTATVLREKAAYGIGVAIKSSLFAEAAYQPTVKKHFSQVSAEWEMKMQSIWTSANVYNYEGADKVVNFATTNDLKVHGHTLVWYRSYPDWFRTINYDSATFESQVKKYIQSTVNRYQGKVISWDVANEIFNDNGTLRSVNCPVYATFKDPIGFYGRCFRLQRGHSRK
jgi:endo-1,4-beta-xylanase